MASSSKSIESNPQHDAAELKLDEVAEPKHYLHREFVKEDKLPTTDRSFVIYMEPTNSSGDIYHILSYIFLCGHSFLPLQHCIQLCYDKEDQALSTTESNLNVKTQIGRSEHLCKSLGQSSAFLKSKYVDIGKSQQAANRRSKTIASYKSTNLINQKTLTTAISFQFNKFVGKDKARAQLHDILRAGFVRQSHLADETKRAVNYKVNTTVAEVSTYLKANNAKHLFLIHYLHVSQQSKAERLLAGYVSSN